MALLSEAAEAFLARNLARRAWPSSRCASRSNTGGLIVAKSVNCKYSPDTDGPGVQPWGHFNPRFTFYIPRDWRAELEEKAVRSGLSIARLIVAAIRAFLDGLLDE